MSDEEESEIPTYTEDFEEEEEDLVEDQAEDETEFQYILKEPNYYGDADVLDDWNNSENRDSVEYNGEDGEFPIKIKHHDKNKKSRFSRGSSSSSIASQVDFISGIRNADEYEGEWAGETEGWQVTTGIPYAEFLGEDDIYDVEIPEYEETSELQIEEMLEVPEVVRISSEENFLRTVMTIPEEFAESRMDQIPTEKIGPDPTLRYFDSEGRISSTTPNISSIIDAIEPRMNRCPSVESFFKTSHSVDCQFYYTADGKIYAKDCRLDVTIWGLKKEISKFVKVPPDNLDFRRKRNLVADKKTLLELGARVKRKIKFTVEINNRVPGNYEIFNPKRHVAKVKPDVKRNLKVETESGIVDLHLVVSYELQKMRYIGGYYDRRKKIKFLNATTQTKFAIPENKLARNRACQTSSNQTTFQQTPLDHGQQMDRRDFRVPYETDKCLYAKEYFSYDWWQEKREKSAVIIQRYWRRWLAIKERKRRIEGLLARIAWAESVRKGRTDQRLAIMDDEIKRQHNPVNLVDMELLYRAINAWRKDEEAFVKENRWGAERKAALATLTEMEADLLLDLEKTKNKIKVTRRDDFINQVFTKMGRPKRWLGTKTNIFINMDSTDKLRVRQMHSLYKDLQQPVEDKEQRLELLEKLSNMIKHFSSNMSKYLMSLITREISMMNRKVSGRLLAGVRLRIANGLFHLSQDPNFNPEAKMLQKVPWDDQKLRKDMVQCKGCRRMQYRDEFTILRGTTVTTRCHNCMNLYRTSILRVDLNLYRHMLKELRRDELQAGVTNSVSLLIDAFDIQFLVEQIWHGQSALSGIDNRYLLRLCRWNKDLPWMPWNCVLLTEEEAVAHLQLVDMNDAYRETFFHKVSITQSAARTYYERLSKLSLNLDDKVKETCEDMHRVMVAKSKRKTHLKSRLKAAFHIKPPST